MSGSNCTPSRNGVSLIIFPSSGLAIDPAGITVFVILFFPNRYTGFDFVDDVATSFKRRTAVSGTDTDPDGHIADFERTDAMNAARCSEIKFLDGFFQNRRAFLDCYFGIGFVFEAKDAAPES